MLFVPSLINGASVLDLDAGALADALARVARAATAAARLGQPHGRTSAPATSPGMSPISSCRLIDQLGGVPALVGYCLGGTMALAAAALRPPPALVLLAAPWRFAGFGEAAQAALRTLWQNARAPAETLGLLPMEVLQSAFWQLDPRRTLAKFERFGAREPGRRCGSALRGGGGLGERRTAAHLRRRARG